MVRPAFALPLARVAVALACWLCAADARAEDRPIVAVLYFDNNTGDPQLDMLKKGFADMMITDLAAVEGMLVVERDRLEELLAEIQLQRAAYFDKKTAVKLGKGLGARYAVTGAFYTATPQLRIDVRLIDIGTGRVLLTSKVVGAQTEIYSLEQTLVSKFVTSLKLELLTTAVPKTRVPDLATLLDYAKGVDLADRGEYEAASQAVAQVIQKAPAFALARVRKEEFLKRLEESVTRRAMNAEQALAALRASTERYFKKPRALKDLSPEDAKVHLAFRALQGRFIVIALSAHLSAGAAGRLRAVLPGHERQATKLMKAYRAAALTLLDELAAYRALHSKTFPNGLTTLDEHYELPDAERRLLEKCGMNRDLRGATREPALALAQFVVMGEVEDLLGARATLAPPLAELEPALRADGFKLYQRAWAEADTQAQAQARAAGPRTPYDAIRALEEHAQALLLRDELREQGIAKLQEILDRYPDMEPRQFERFGTRIKEELGLVHQHGVSQLERYAKALQTCDDMDLRVPLGTISERRVRLRGLPGLDQLVDEIERRCKGKPKLTGWWPYLYNSIALSAARLEDCARFDAYLARSIAVGASKRDARAYRKNYSKCPTPAKDPAAEP
ncbi:MAG: CsgG/HfaB family protein [Kofleriaceae bacterium]